MRKKKRLYLSRIVQPKPSHVAFFLAKTICQMRLSNPLNDFVPATRKILQWNTIFLTKDRLGLLVILI